MLKKTYALGLLAAAALGCVLTPSAQASQVEVNNQTGSQNAEAVGHGNAVLQDLDQGSLQNQLKVPGSSGYYHSQPGETQIQVSGQNAVQDGTAAGTGNAVLQDLDQNNLQKPFNF